MVNCIVSFEPVGYSDGPKGDVLTALYYINVRLNVRLTGTTPQLNPKNSEIGFMIVTYSRRLQFSLVNSKRGPIKK